MGLQQGGLIKPSRDIRSPEDLAAEAKLLSWGVPEKKLTRRAIDEVRELLRLRGEQP